VKQRHNVTTAYARVAAEYREKFAQELKHKPLDRALLDVFADEVRDKGTVADVGCGPGHIAAYLHERGVKVVGIDLSDDMIAHAKRAAPTLDFREGNMLSLDDEADSLAGIVSLYSIVHLEPDEVSLAAREFFRVLKPGGRVLLSFHIGDERVTMQEWFGKRVKIEWVFFSLDFVVRQLEEAGFVVDAKLVRAPYEPIEHPSQRAYLMAKKA
jgi:SAM-dependent methyltransferase